MARKRPDWPSLDEQLTDAKVTRGSALEQLIRDNQDPRILRPGETTDDEIGLPLWLRVYWRSRHPGESSSPAGDYPDVLGRLHGWMLLNQDLTPDPSAWLRVHDTEAGSQDNGE